MSINTVIRHHNNILKDAKESINEAIRCVKHAKDYRWGGALVEYDAIVGHCESIVRELERLCGEEEE